MSHSTPTPASRATPDESSSPDSPASPSPAPGFRASRSPDPPVLVLGATGKTGRRVADRLRLRGVAVRVGSRAADPPFSWEDRATWGPVLDGVGAVYVAYVPDLAVAGAAETVGAFAAAAEAAGARRIVLLSGRGEPEAQRAEEAIRRPGLAWTVVRCAWFAQNFDESFLLDPVLAGAVALPVGDVREPFVDLDDVADVAVAALTEDEHDGEVHELTGPEALTFAEALATIGAAAGREVRHVRVSPLAFAADLTAAGLPDEIVGLMTYLFGEVLDGRNTATTDGVRRALGRDPRAFGDYARAAATTGVWDVAEVAR